MWSRIWFLTDSFVISSKKLKRKQGFPHEVKSYFCDKLSLQWHVLTAKILYFPPFFHQFVFSTAENLYFPDTKFIHVLIFPTILCYIVKWSSRSLHNILCWKYIVKWRGPDRIFVTERIRFKKYYFRIHICDTLYSHLKSLPFSRLPTE